MSNVFDLLDNENPPSEDELFQPCNEIDSHCSESTEFEESSHSLTFNIPSEVPPLSPTTTKEQESTTSNTPSYHNTINVLHVQTPLLAGVRTGIASFFAPIRRRICLQGITSTKSPNGRIITLSHDATLAFDEAFTALETARTSNDLTCFIEACSTFPFYAPLLYETGMLLLKADHASKGHELIRSSLASLEPVFRPFINQNQSRDECFFDPDDDLVTVFLQSLATHARLLARSGKFKSAVECCKFALQVDCSDKFRFLVLIDEFFLKSRSPSDLVDFIRNFELLYNLTYFEFKRLPCLTMIPSFALSYSIALAELHSPSNDILGAFNQCFLLFPEFISVINGKLFNESNIPRELNSFAFKSNSISGLPGGSDLVFFMYLQVERLFLFLKKHISFICQSAAHVADLINQNADVYKRARYYRSIYIPPENNYFELFSVNYFTESFLEESDQILIRLQQHQNNLNRAKFLKAISVHPIILFFKSLLPWFSKPLDQIEDYR
ncbi:hypothetical protein P9112_012973 [Eukaryota sp. TZLM1-RC]